MPSSGQDSDGKDHPSISFHREREARLQRIEARLDRMETLAQKNALDTARRKGTSAIWGGMSGAIIATVISSLVTWVVIRILTETS